MKWNFARLIALAQTFLLPLVSRASTLESQPIFNALNSTESVIQQAHALEKLAGLPISSKNRSAQIPALGISHDRMRSKIQLNNAIAHLTLNDNQRALELAQAAYKETYEADAIQATQLLKVIYESERKMNRLADAAESCVRFVARGTGDDDWLLSCAHTLQRSSNPNPEGTVVLTRQTLHAFAYAQEVRSMKNHALQSAILLSGSFENLSLKSEARDYLQRAIHIAPKTDSWLARAKYTLALRDINLGFKERARASLLELSNSEEADSVTRIYSKVMLARTMETSGQYEVSETLYRDATAMAESLSSAPPLREVHIGKTETSVPERVPNIFTKNERDRLFGEMALTLCAHKKWDDCEKTYKRLPTSTLFENNADILLRSHFMLRNSSELVTSFLGYSEADLNFVDHQKNLSETLDIQELQERTRALHAIAKSYMSHAQSASTVIATQTVNRSANIDRLEKIREELENATKEMRSMHLTLASSISTAELQQLPSEKRLADSENQLKKLAQDLELAVNKINAHSMTHWNTDDGGYSSAVQHQLALLARMKSLTDPFADFEERPRQNSQDKIINNLVANSSNFAAQISENRARVSAVNFLKTLSTDKNSIAKIEKNLKNISPEVCSAQKKSEDILLDFRVAALRRASSTVLAVRLERTHETLRKLSELHSRLFHTPQNEAETESLGVVRKSWNKLLIASQTLRDAEGIIRAQCEKERANTLDRVIAIQQEISALTQNMTLITNAMQQEMQINLVSAAKDIYPIVRTFHDRIRIAVADTNIQAVQELELDKSKIARATEERNLWMDSLRKTLDWELGR